MRVMILACLYHSLNRAILRPIAFKNQFCIFNIENNYISVTVSGQQMNLRLHYQRLIIHGIELVLNRFLVGLELVARKEFLPFAGGTGTTTR